jgi:hypothetical protein
MNDEEETWNLPLTSFLFSKTGKIVALKKILLQGDDEGVPATSIREIALLKEVSQVSGLSIKDHSDFTRLIFFRLCSTATLFNCWR